MILKKKILFRFLPKWLLLKMYGLQIGAPTFQKSPWQKIGKLVRVIPKWGVPLFAIDNNVDIKFYLPAEIVQTKFVVKHNKIIPADKYYATKTSKILITKRP